MSNWAREVIRARAEWTRWLQSTGHTLTVKRVPRDTDGAAISEGATVLYTGVPYAEGMAVGSGRPNVTLSSSAQRRADAYIPYPNLLSFPFGTDIQRDDRLEVEPVNTGRPVWIAGLVDLGDPDQFDLEVQVMQKVVPPHAG